VRKLVFVCGLALLLGSATLQAQTCVPQLLGADRRGPARAISRTGSTLYVGTGAALLVVDVTDRANPVERGFVNLESIVRDVVAAGTTAVVLGADGLTFVDASDPGEPVVSGFWSIPSGWSVAHIDARGTTAFVPATDGLHIVDFTDPDDVVEVGFFATSDARDVVTRGTTRAYIVGNESLHALDVSTLSSPTLVSSTLLPVGADAHLTIGPNGGRLASWRNHPSHHPWSEIALFDLSDPDLPLLRWTADGDPVAAISVAGDRAYIGSSIFDISNPSQPTWLGALSVDEPSAHATTGNPDLLYVADSTRGIVTTDVGDPGSVLEVDLVAVPTETLDGYVAGDLALLVERHGLRAVSLDASSFLSTIGDLRTPEAYLRESTRLASHALVSGWFGDPIELRLGFVDLSDPSEPSFGLMLPLDYKANPVVDNDRLYAVTDVSCSNGQSLSIYAVADTATPTLLAEIAFNEGCYGYDFTAAGNRLYLWHYVGTYPTGQYRLAVLDVTDPTDPIELASIPEPWALQASIAMGRLVLGTTSESFELFDFTLPGAPVLLGSVPLPPSSGGGIQKISRYGSRVTAPRDLGYVSVVDLSSPSAPFEWAAVESPGSAESAALGSGVLVVADGVAGYSVYESCSPFADGFESGDTSEWSPPTP
jgi:hypothetical protein